MICRQACDDDVAYHSKLWPVLEVIGVGSNVIERAGRHVPGRFRDIRRPREGSRRSLFYSS
jgi:hypothetical protein